MTAPASRPSAPTGLLRRLRLYGSMVRYGFAHNQDFAREHWAFFQTMRERLGEHGIADLERLRAVDVGCGKMMWLTLLMHSVGTRVTGIDTEWVEPNPTFGKYWGIMRSNGVERAARTLAWDLLYASPYYRALDGITPFELHFRDADARAMSADDLDFETDSIDLAVSHEVFEHLPDVEGAIRELSRVIRPEGLTYVYTHNYTSISGGHHIAWKYPDTEPSEIVPPWDHLRENRFPDVPSWINGWREHQYREVWERYFEIEDWIPTDREGEALLTAEIREELAEYSEQELLTKGFIVVARPKADSRRVDS
ncbi:MAG: methyltransferase domain-containing protein [Thermoanaerobaculia bacterium]|nr:methyltransferase domain-containing protein [Thermoanaerobaculia bacterium]